MLRRVVGTALVLGFILAGGARAHHGFDGRYNLAVPVWVEGIVLDAYFGHPHSELTVQVSSDVAMPAPLPDLGPAASFLDAQALVIREDLVGQTIVLELSPTPQYSSLGDRIARGDRIAAVAVRTCEPPYQLNVQWLRLPDGEVESRTGAMSCRRMLTEILDTVASWPLVGYLRTSRTAYATVNAAHIGNELACRSHRQLRPENRRSVEGGSLARGGWRHTCRLPLSASRSR